MQGNGAAYPVGFCDVDQNHPGFDPMFQSVERMTGLRKASAGREPSTEVGLAARRDPFQPDGGRRRLGDGDESSQLVLSAARSPATG
jgi:hypothetical protein